MFRIMLQKMIHKKWMMLSLLIGNILLIATAVSHPLYLDASLGRMLREEFAGYEEENGEDPTRISLLARFRKEDGREDYARMEALSEQLPSILGVSNTSLVHHDRLIETKAVSLINKGAVAEDAKLFLGKIEDLPEHVQVMSGRMYADSMDDAGRIEAVVTVSGFVEMDLLVGEELELPFLKDEEGKPFHVIITGVVDGDGDEAFWAEKPESLTRELLISDRVFEDLFQNPLRSRTYEYDRRMYLTFDYSRLSVSGVKRLLTGTQQLLTENTAYGRMTEPAYLSFLESFLSKEKKIEVTLLILQVPLLVLLCAFLFMISGQLFEMEKGEISLLTSRGASKGQIFGLYLLQALTLCTVALLFGLPLGKGICSLLGSASAFMTFVSRKPLPVALNVKAMLYALIAILVSLFVTVTPVLKQTRVTIVKEKSARSIIRKPIWQRFFLDILLLGVSLYGYYNFLRQKEAFVGEVMSGGDVDPLLFLSSSLFILGAALLCLRLQPLLVKGIFAIGKKKWKVAGYTSFLEIIRTGPKLYFIMTFLMLTVGLGIFNTTTARTIEENASRNLRYQIGADLVMQEVWKDNSIARRMDPSLPLVYTEADFGKYGQIEGVSSMTRVYRNDHVNIGKALKGTDVTLLGIHTKTFGETAFLPAGLVEKHFYTYLNEMSTDLDYVLVSSSFRDNLGYAIGDTISYSNGDGVINGVIQDFVDYFPSYEPSQAILLPDGSSQLSDQYLIVAHLSTIQKNWGITPYQIWFSFEDAKAKDNYYDLVEKEEIPLSYLADLGVELARIKRDTLFEGTNGILTMSFMIILILCIIGYLIYWILSIRSRELLFGVLRAMGMTRAEVIRMLIGEQIFSSLLSVVSGAGIGWLSSRLFVPILQTGYALADQSLPMQMVTRPEDMVRLFGMLFVMLFVCFGVLARQIRKLKITQALKLGEE